MSEIRQGINTTSSHSSEKNSVKAADCFTSKDFDKYDWKIEVNPNAPKEEDEFDVIIIGSGLGGLSCGCLLSKRGYKVLVLEQHHQVGGFCSSFKRRGFIFNNGLEEITGLWKKGPINLLCKELGLNTADYFVKHSTGIRCVFRGNDIYVRDGLQEFTKLLSERFPNEGRNINAFFSDAEKAHNDLFKDAEVYGTPLPPELIAKAFGPKKLADYPKECANYIDWANKTIKQKLDDHFDDEDLKALLSSFMNYLGTEPARTPAWVILRYYGILRHEIYFSKGGAQRYADSLRDFIESHGGKVLIKHKVNEILVENREVKGVKVGDKAFRSPVVVSNANAKLTFLELIDRLSLDEPFIEYIKRLRMSDSVFLVFLGVDMDLSNYPAITHNRDEGCLVVIGSNSDPSSAPKGKSNVWLYTHADYDDFPERGTEGYSRKKKEFTEVLIKKADKIIPGLRQHIIVQDAATPKTLERYTSMPKGASEAFEETIDNAKPCFKTPVTGLYLAGSSTFPGSGIELVTMSGIICANDICDWQITMKGGY